MRCNKAAIPDNKYQVMRRYKPFYCLNRVSISMWLRDNASPTAPCSSGGCQTCRTDSRPREQLSRKSAPIVGSQVISCWRDSSSSYQARTFRRIALLLFGSDVPGKMNFLVFYFWLYQLFILFPVTRNLVFGFGNDK